MRKLKLTLKRVSGAINEFHAWVNGNKVIRSDDPAEDPEWEDDVPDEKLRVHVKVYGIGKAKYAVSIDLPGTADDQKVELQLEGGYHDATFEI